MSLGLPRGKELDPGFTLPPALPGLRDDLLTNPAASHVDVRGWFDEPDRPFELEIGSGKGTFLIQEAARRPETNFLGIEYALEFYQYAADRIRRAGLRNVRLLGIDASEFVRWRMPSGICDVIHLYFADPWPKTKHHRRRMVQDRFLADCVRVLRQPAEGVPGGELRIVTDHAEYWAWMEQHFARWCGPSHAFDREAFIPVLPEREEDGAAERTPSELVGTNFERKYRQEGRPFYSTTLRLARPKAAFAAG